MRSLLFELYDGLNSVYSGWIIWNLFLAFVPMLLSFHLFRPQAIPARYLQAAWLVTGLAGAIGISARSARIRRSLAGSWHTVQTGNPEVMWQLLWLAIVALVAIAVSVWLSRQTPRSKMGRWGVGLAVFIAFLPNAPYILTDVVHIIRAAGYGDIRVWVIALALIPLHVCAMLLGFEAYVIALMNINYFLKQRGLGALIWPTELSLHALCALGIYLGRFIRLNSWDILLDPTSIMAIALNTLTSKRPVAVIFVTFVILTVTYWLMKQITLGLKLRYEYARKGLDPLV
ncbi:DUF1361 domain-containing protein [Leptolyngbya iicbica]|uniref:DUF1361 domain-containing protein n=2 Tax=Cyanophyceae TaxID=3028117 RepID=A0A4V2E3A9_9CYAN|nr:DUF1361 domain-containing protein [Leptolyngbya sp. LK]RZM81800.1 DUF1361 domain-containing protein [Leptolyngbya sp. LK]